MSEGCLSALDESLTQIGDAKCGSIGVADLEVNNGIAREVRSICEIRTTKIATVRERDPYISTFTLSRVLNNG